MYGGLLSRLQHIRAGPVLRSKVLDYYDFKYANKESRADELMHTLPVQIQYELTKRCIELLNLPEEMGMASAAPRGSLHGGRSTRVAPRGSLHEGRSTGGGRRSFLY